MKAAQKRPSQAAKVLARAEREKEATAKAERDAQARLTAGRLARSERHAAAQAEGRTAEEVYEQVMQLCYPEWYTPPKPSHA